MLFENHFRDTNAIIRYSQKKNQTKYTYLIDKPLLKSSLYGSMDPLQTTACGTPESKESTARILCISRRIKRITRVDSLDYGSYCVIL